MQITINTEQELSALDLRVLRALAGDNAEEAVSKPAKPAAAPAKATAAPKAEKAAKKPEPDEDEDTTEEGDGDEDEAKGPTLQDAVALATKLVSGGKAKEVKAALTELGAKRVSELDEDSIPQFIDKLS